MSEHDEDSGASVAVEAPPSASGRVPLDQRLLGFDRRTIWPGIFALAVWAVWGHVIPWVNEQVEFDDPIEAGDRIDLGGGEVTFEPTVGWNLVSGVRVDDVNVTPVGATASAGVADETALLTATRAAWDGTADELLDRSIDISEGFERLIIDEERQRIDITSVDGIAGRLAYFVGVDQQAVVASYVFETVPATEGVEPVSVGVTFEAYAPTDGFDDLGTEIGEMIVSLDYTPSTEEES